MWYCKYLEEYLPRKFDKYYIPIAVKYQKIPWHVLKTLLGTEMKYQKINPFLFINNSVSQQH